MPLIIINLSEFRGQIERTNFSFLKENILSNWSYTMPKSISVSQIFCLFEKNCPQYLNIYLASCQWYSLGSLKHVQDIQHCQRKCVRGGGLYGLKAWLYFLFVLSPSYVWLRCYQPASCSCCRDFITLWTVSPQELEAKLNSSFCNLLLTEKKLTLSKEVCSPDPFLKKWN